MKNDLRKSYPRKSISSDSENSNTVRFNQRINDKSPIKNHPVLQKLDSKIFFDRQIDQENISSFKRSMLLRQAIPSNNKFLAAFSNMVKDTVGIIKQRDSPSPPKRRQSILPIVMKRRFQIFAPPNRKINTIEQFKTAVVEAEEEFSSSEYLTSKLADLKLSAKRIITEARSRSVNVSKYTSSKSVIKEANLNPQLRQIKSLRKLHSVHKSSVRSFEAREMAMKRGAGVSTYGNGSDLQFSVSKIHSSTAEIRERIRGVFMSYKPKKIDIQEEPRFLSSIDKQRNHLRFNIRHFKTDSVNSKTK